MADGGKPDDAVVAAATEEASAARRGEGQRRAEEALSRGSGLPTEGLLSFYDRLRRRVLRTVENRGGKLGARSAQALLLVPDIFMLLVRLVLDEEVPRATRALVGGALAYFLLPADLLPEVLLGAGGYVEDLVLAAVVLSHAFAEDLEPYAERHWSGSRELRQVLSDILRAAEALLGENLYGRLKRVLERRGVRVEPG